MCCGKEAGIVGARALRSLAGLLSPGKPLEDFPWSGVL